MAFIFCLLILLILYSSYFQNIFVFPGSYTALPRKCIHPATKIEQINGKQVAYRLHESSKKKKQICFFFHGNGYSASDASYYFKGLSDDLGMTVLVPDYPGYGKTAGRITKDEDLWRCIEPLMKRYREGGYRIFVCGESIGSAAAVSMASDGNNKIAGLILLGAFTRLGDLVWRPFRWLLRYDFNNVKNIARVRCPVFIAHGQRDDIIPVSHAKKLKKACQNDAHLSTKSRRRHMFWDRRESGDYEVNKEIVGEIRSFIGRVS